MINDNKQYPPPDYGPGHHGGGPGSVASGHPHSPPPPPQTSITLNTDPTPGARVTEINLNIGYFKTLPGILKLVQLVIGIICMACASPARGLQETVPLISYNTVVQYQVGNNYGVGHNHWFLFVVVTSFIITLLWTFYYFLQIRESINVQMPITWLSLEYYYTAVVTVLYFIAFIVILAGFGYCAGRNSNWCNARVTAGVFGIFNTIAYGLGAYILRNDIKATPPELQ